MKSVLVAAMSLLVSVSAVAADSTWLLCNNGALAVNSVERRAGIDDRSTNIKLMLGVHLFSGELKNTDSGPVLLKGKSSQDVFTGTMNFNYTNNILTLKGTLKIDGQPFAIPAQRLSCKQMHPNL